MVTHQPDIRETDRFNVTSACKVLGISRGTFYTYAALCGVRKHIPRLGGFPYYTGKEIMKIWLRA